MARPKANRIEDGDEGERVTVGKRITEARERAKISQRELAKRMKYTQTWLNAIEGGRNRISASDLARIAKELEYPLDFFLVPDWTPRHPVTPKTRTDWDFLYPEEPERAAAHHELDQAFRRLEALYRERGDAN